MAILAASGSLTASWNGTGTAPAGSVVLLAVADTTSLGFELTGTFNATILLEGTFDDLTWFALVPQTLAGVGMSATLTTPARGTASVADMAQVRARCSVYVSGAAVITLDASAAAGGAMTSGGGGGAITAADGALVTIGTTTDAAAGTDTGAFSIIAFWKRFMQKLTAGLPLKDGITANMATVSAFHAADNQSPGGTAFGLLTGGVAQLLNPAGNLDRQRETGTDNIPGLGVATGTQQLASPFATTVAATILAGTRTVTPAAMSGTTRGSAWSIQVGSVLLVDVGGVQEKVVVTAVAPTTFTAVFANGHTGPWAVAGFTFNQAKDATAPDGSLGTGFSAGATYLLNTGLNAAAGGWESERSFLGELAGASGAGSAIAVEYEDTAGGPVLASGLASGLRLVPAQALQAKGLATAAITASVAGNTNLVFASAPATNLILAGWPVTLTGSGTTEVVYTTTAWVPGSSATIPLQSPVVNTGQTTATWDIFAASGPGLSKFLPTGIGIEEEALWDPVTAGFYIERSATQDNVPMANLVMETPGLWNGTGGDRQRSNLDVNLISQVNATTTYTSPDQLNVNGMALYLFIRITTISASTLTITVNAKDPASGQYFLLLSSTALAATGNTLLKIGPALTPAANLVSNDWLPRTFQIVATPGDGTAKSYTIGYSLIE